MKKYFAYFGECYYPSQAMEDFVGDFDTLDDAIAILTERYRTRSEFERANKWAVIWDSQTRCLV